MRGHFHFCQAFEQILGDAIVDDAFALDCGLFLSVEGCGIVFEMLDDRAGLGAFIDNLGFAFVELFAVRGFFFLSSNCLALAHDEQKQNA